MLTKYFNLSIKTQLMILVLILMLILLITNILPYYIAQNIIQDKVSASAYKTMSQVKENISSFYRDMESLCTSVAYNPVIQEFMRTDSLFQRYELDRSVQTIFINTIRIKQSIMGIRLYNTKGECLNSIGNSNNSIDVDGIDAVIQAQKSENVRYTGLMINSKVYPQSGNRYYFLVVFPIYLLGGEDLRDLKGMCVLVIDCKYFEKIVKDAIITPNSRFSLLDGSGLVMASENPDQVGKSLKYAGMDTVFDNNASQASFPVFTLQKGLIIQVMDIPETGWRIVSTIPNSELTEDLNIIRRWSLVAYAIALALLGAGMAGFYLGIVNPMNKVFVFMRSILTLGIESRFPGVYKNEIGMLVSHINTMLEDIEKLSMDNQSAQTKMYQLEISRKQVEISALQNQINPHFLYNTLECVKSIAIYYKSQEIVDISTSMSNLFRYSIKRTDFVQIAEEISCLRHYMTIIRIRFREHIRFELDIDPEALPCKTLKMVLQPIVENAVYHGLEQKIVGGCVRIHVFRSEENQVTYDIEDDGMGMTETALAEINETLSHGVIDFSFSLQDKYGIGLVNIHQRLQLFYGEHASMHLESRLNEMTRVHITFPMEAEADV